MKRITVLLADDHTVLRQGLRALLGLHPDLEVVGEAGNARAAVAAAKRIQPDVVLMDVAMPLLNGREATRKILEVAPGARVLVLSCNSDDDCVAQMLEAGATGYLLKHAVADELAQAIRDVRRGVKVLSPAIAKRRQDNQQAAFVHGCEDRRTRLTARQTEVLQLIAESFSNQEMAAELGISIKTVEKHRQQLMNNLDIHDVAGLTRFVIAQCTGERRQHLAA
jgi:DNA-binding NarL/FixJ family response regulator